MSAEIFRTVISIPPSDKKITYKTASLLIGSCFTENMGNKLLWFKLPVFVNPFGISYNPLSIKKSLDRLISGIEYTAKEISYSDGLYFSFDHHSRFSDVDQKACIAKINVSFSEAGNYLKKTSFLFLTFGTAYYYTLNSDKQIVANCHKLPEKEFSRTMLTVNEIYEAYSELIPHLMEINPHLYIVFTVSPIRHWKDGAHENQISKSVLLLAIDSLCKKFKNTGYFSAYELMLDELRDYRFYEEDMLHPNKIAIDFIWKRFAGSFIENDTSRIMNEVDKIQLSRQHRPFNIKTEVFQNFVLQQMNKIKQLNQLYPEIDLSAEYEYFANFLG